MSKSESANKSIQISSNLTLLFKIAIPIFWVIFFGAFTYTALTTPIHTAFPISKNSFQFLAILFFLSGFFLLYFTLWQLKRVEFFPDSFYATDYFKHYRYGYGSIASISYINLLLFKIMIIKLSQKGHFGWRIPLIISRKRHQLFREIFPKMSESLGLK